MVNGKPFYIKGAGLEFGEIASLAKHNGNSFRTWENIHGKQSGKQILDEAKKYEINGHHGNWKLEENAMDLTMTILK